MSSVREVVRCVAAEIDGLLRDLCGEPVHFVLSAGTVVNAPWGNHVLWHCGVTSDALKHSFDGHVSVSGESIDELQERLKEIVVPAIVTGRKIEAEVKRIMEADHAQTRI